MKKTMRPLSMVLAVLLAVSLGPVRAFAAEQPTVRIKDITRVEGVRDNQLVGLGLVVGLNGTGDSRSSQANVQMVANMLDHFEVMVTPEDLRLRNVAAVIVTADLPAFVRSGDRIDVTVSSFGDARSLQGGYLVLTPLRAPNGEVYAVAQGPVSIGGFNVRTAGAGVQQNHTAVGRVVGGAIVERDAPGVIGENGIIRLVLTQPDFTTAARIAQAVNELFLPDTAVALDRSVVELRVPELFLDHPVEFLSIVEELTVTPDQEARVIINERTGTIVIGHNVRIASVAVAHGNLSVRVESETVVSQPPAFSEGTTEVVTETRVWVEEGDGRLMVLPSGVTVQELVDALNAIGAGPRDIISILQAIKAAGSLFAELEVL